MFYYSSIDLALCYAKTSEKGKVHVVIIEKGEDDRPDRYRFRCLPYGWYLFDNLKEKDECIFVESPDPKHMCKNCFKKLHEGYYDDIPWEKVG
jgi:hypothetical protein